MVPPQLISLSSRQGGAFSRFQAVEYGLSDEFLRTQVTSKRWQRVHRGVYVSFTGELPYLTRVWAALLAVGPGAAATEETALRLFGFGRYADVDHLIVAIDHSRFVGAPRGVTVRRRRRLALSLHPVRQPPTERLEESALGVLARLARSNRLQDGIGLLSDLCGQRLTTADRLRTSIGSHPGLPGRRLWLPVLDDVAAGAHSFLEVSYLRDVERGHGLPTPNRQFPGRRANGLAWRDAVYELYKVAVEIDGRVGYEWLADRLADSIRDLVAGADGLFTVRIGYPHVADPCTTALHVANLLTARGWRGRPCRCGPSCKLDVRSWAA